MGRWSLNMSRPQAAEPPPATRSAEPRGSDSGTPPGPAWTLRSALEHLNNVQYSDKEATERTNQAVQNDPTLLIKAARSGMVEVWKVVVAALGVTGQHLLEKALQVKNGEGDTVLTSAVRSEELAVVKEVLECVTDYLTDKKVKRLLLATHGKFRTVLDSAATAGNIGVWVAAVEILKRKGLLEQALHTNGSPDAVVRSAIMSKELAMVKEVFDFMRQNVPDRQKFKSLLIPTEYVGHEETVLGCAAEAGNIGVWAAVADIYRREGLLEQALRSKVVTSAFKSKESAMVTEVFECVRQTVPDRQKVESLLLSTDLGTPLHCAAQTGNIGVWAAVVKIVKREQLLEQALNKMAGGLNTVVMGAVDSKEPAMIEEVVNCVRQNTPDQVKRLLLQANDCDGTVLHRAAEAGSIGVWLAVVNILKREGLLEEAINTNGPFGETLLAKARESRKRVMVKHVVHCVRQNIPDQQKVKDLLAELSEEERAELSPPEEDVALHPMGGNAVPVDQTSSSRADGAEQEIRVQADGKSDTEDMPEESDKLEEEIATSEPGAGNVVPAQQPPPSRVEDTEQEFRVQVATFPELHGITMNNRDALEEVKDLLGNPVPGTSGADFRSGTELIDVDKLRELDELVSIAKALGGIVSRYSEDENLQRKETALDPGVKAYHGVIRTGLCNAYLAASVVGSGVVSSSKLGVMGKAGAALKLISGAVPVLGGLAGLAGAALKAGDCCIQTRLVLKMTDLAPDAVECSKLARTLCLRLTDRLTDGTIASSHYAAEDPKHSAASVDWGAGGSTSNLGSGGVDEDVVIEWFVEGIADCELPNLAAKIEAREVKAGKRLGRRHLHKILTAVGRDCLQDTSTTEEKVDRLLKVIPEASVRSVATVAMPEPEMSFSRSPVLAPSHDGGVDQGLKFAALQAKLEALELAGAKQQEEVEALKSDKERLLSKVVSMEKRIPKPHTESGDSMDAGGGLKFAKKRRAMTKTKEEFDEEMENPARATDRQSVTADDVRVTQAHVEELGRETGHLGARISALEESKGKKRGLRTLLRGKR